MSMTSFAMSSTFALSGIFLTVFAVFVSSI
jgi:hypothetical protein